MAKAEIKYDVSSGGFVGRYELPGETRNKWKVRWHLTDETIAKIEDKFAIYVHDIGLTKVLHADVERSVTEALQHCEWLKNWLECSPSATMRQIG